MAGGKKVASIVVLVVVVVAAVIFAISRGTRFGGPKVPDEVMERANKQEVEFLDEESLVVITKTLGEWKELGKQDGKFKNPNTGKYTMVSPIVCYSCGAKIPQPDFADGGGPQDDPAAMAARYETMRAHKCPKCGKAAYGTGSGY